MIVNQKIAAHAKKDDLAKRRFAQNRLFLRFCQFPNEKFFP